MTNKEFLEELTKRGFTPAWYIDHYHNYDSDSAHQLVYPEYIQLQLDYLSDKIAESTSWEEEQRCNVEIDRLKKGALDETLGAFKDFKQVDHYGGGEGEGEHFHVVLHFLAFDKYVRAEAHYQSYDGISCFDDEWTVVEPKEVTVIKYQPVIE